MSNIGLDSVLLTQQAKGRLGRVSLRKGLLGIGIEVENFPAFKKAYEKSMRGLFKKFDKKFSRPVYASKDLGTLFEYEGIEEELEVLEEFKQLVLPEIKRVHFFYTYIFGLKGLVSIYGESPNYRKIPLTSQDKGVQDFYDLISNSYPMLCAWELRSQKIDGKLFLDNFQGRVCPAWEELSASADISIYFKGDQCNELISTADLFVRLIKLKMVPNLSCFLEGEIKKIAKIFDGKCESYFMGKQCLKKMVPHKTMQIKCNHLAQHPIVYLVKENPKEEGEETIIENSPLFNKVVKETNALGGCMKYFHPEDSKTIETGDLMVSFGKRGEATFEKLVKLGYQIKKF